MDKLDKCSLGAIIGLAVWTLILVVAEVQRPPDPRAAEATKATISRRFLDPDFDKKIKLAKDLLVNGNVAKADQLISGMVQAYPYEGMVHMLKGDVALHRQIPIQAMLSYREAVDLNPDYLDKKSDEFQGKKIKMIVEEAREAIDTGLVQQPGNQELQENRKVIFYMLRKIAGSCG